MIVTNLTKDELHTRMVGLATAIKADANARFDLDVQWNNSRMLIEIKPSEELLPESIELKSS